MERLVLDRDGRTPIEISLRPTQLMEGGITAVLLQKGASRSWISATEAIVARCFPSGSETPEHLRPASTWRECLGAKLAGQSYFVETSGPFARRIGVIDCVFAYIETSGNYTPQTPVVGIHGLYHYVSLPRQYFALRLAVTPEYQRRGFGAKFFWHNCGIALNAGATSHWLFTEADPVKNRSVLELYRRWGYRETGLTQYYNNELQVFMSLDLSKEAARQRALKFTAL